MDELNPESLPVILTKEYLLRHLSAMQLVLQDIPEDELRKIFTVTQTPGTPTSIVNIWLKLTAEQYTRYKRLTT